MKFLVFRKVKQRFRKFSYAISNDEIAYNDIVIAPKT